MHRENVGARNMNKESLYNVILQWLTREQTCFSPIGWGQVRTECRLNTHGQGLFILVCSHLPCLLICVYAPYAKDAGEECECGIHKSIITSQRTSG